MYSITRPLFLMLASFCSLAMGACWAADAGDEVQEIRDDFMSDAMEARDAYRKQLRKYARSAVTKLEKVAATAVRDGDLGGATEAMEQVLWLDRDNKKAVTHFQAIGRLEEVLEELEDEPIIPEASDEVNASKLGRQLVGTVWSWGGKGTISFGDRGVASVSFDEKPNSRAWEVKPDGTVFVLGSGPQKYLSILKFDLRQNAYGGVSYKINNPEVSGRRVR